MKKVMFLLAGLFIAGMAQAQDNVKKPPVITVTGSAEIEITPDIIYLDISLREYKGKDGKVSINALESQLQKAVQDAGIPAADLTVSNVFGNNYEAWLNKKKKNNDFMARKQYRLKLSKLDKVNAILDGVDDTGIESVNISSYTSSKMEEYRKQVKMKAIEAAKAKADYMLEAIGSRNGGAYEVEEINTDNYSDVQPVMTNVMLGYAAKAADTNSSPDINFKTIKVRAEVRASFYIQ